MFNRDEKWLDWKREAEVQYFEKGYRGFPRAEFRIQYLAGKTAQEAVAAVGGRRRPYGG